MAIKKMSHLVVSALVISALALSASAIETVSPGNADDAAAINAAIGRAAEGDGKVQLQDGTYHLNAPITVNVAVELIGNDADRSQVVLDGGSKNRILYTKNTEAFVHGVTFANGSSDGSACAGVEASYAGAVFTANGVISNCTFQAVVGAWCSVGISGGGVITDCEVRDGKVTNWNGGAAGNGGGVKLGGSGILRRTLVTGCQSAYGGGVALRASTPLVEDCVISNNVGGGAMVTSGTMRNCVICDNTQSTCGGVYMNGAGVVADCLITRNESNNGGGVNIDNGTLRHCSVVGNTATVSAPGIWQKNGTVESCIAWNNGTSTYLKQEMSYVREGGTCTYTCAAQAPAGNGNINDRLPVFADAANGDWSLTAASPCRGAGKDGVDMGAFPYAEPAAPRVSFAYVLADGAAPASTTFTASLEGDCGEATSYSWNFGDGTVDTTSGAEAYHEYASAGRYTVTLTVTTEKAGALSYAVENAVNLGSNEIWVDSKAGEGEFPYATPDTACSDISKALAAMLIGEGQVGKLHLKDGTYPVTAPIAVDRPIEVIGNDADRSQVVLDGQGKYRILYTKNAKAFVHGVTFANGNASDGASYAGVEAHYAGAVFTAGGVISNCTFRAVNGNYSSVGISGDGVITDCEILDGEVTNGNGGSAGNGGGVKMKGGVLRRTLVSHCVAQWGGGIRVNGGLVDACVISNNASKVTGMGGGIYQNGGVVSNSVIVCNADDAERKTSSVRGVYMVNGTMVGCLITGNRGVTGGGVYKTNGTLRNCTVSGNVGTTANGGVVQTGGDIENCIIVSNGRSGSADDSLGVNGGTVTYTCALPKPTGEGNIGVDPMFVNAEAGDFRLNGASPCIDVGLNGGWGAEGLDLAGTPRILAGKPDGTETIDLGCYEYDLSKAPPSCAFEVIGEWTTTKPPLEVTFKASTQGGVGTVNGYIWNFGDGKSETTTAPEVTHEFTDFGNYTVSLTLDCTGGAVAPFERKSAVSIRPTVVFVSTSGSGTEPYDTPQKATSNLVDAIDAVAVPDEGLGIVHVAAGTYVRQNGNTIPVAKAIRIIGDDGPDVTTVSVGKETINSDLDAVITVTAEKAIVEGLSFRGANKGIRLLSLEGGTVRNCIFSETTSRKSPVNITGGTLDGCVIRNSTADTNLGTTGYADGGFFINAGIMQNCVVSNCYGSSQGAGSLEGGMVSNCLFVANKHGGKGGVGVVRVAAGTLANCEIRGNYTDTRASGVVGLSASGGTARNCLVADNRGIGAVGLWASGSAKVENVTVAGNVTTGEGVTTGVKAASSANLANVLAWGVGAAAVNAIDAGATCTTCLFDKDPIFRNAVRGDYRIKNGSPAQNAGTNLGWMQGAVDLFGNPRILDKIVDIGCYEKGLTGLAIIVR